MMLLEDVMCDSAKDRFVLIRESEKKPPLFFCTGTLSQIKVTPAAATRPRRPGVNVKLDEYTVRIDVDNVLEVKEGMDGKRNANSKK